MPITQDRMLRLIEAGERYQFLYDSLMDLSRHEFAKAAEGVQTYEQAAHNISMQFIGIDHQDARMALALERQHYKLTHQRNRYDRAKKAKERGAGAHRTIGDAPQAQADAHARAQELAAQTDATDPLAGTEADSLFDGPSPNDPSPESQSPLSHNREQGISSHFPLEKGTGRD